jgi:prephenate dehydrogenase
MRIGIIGFGPFGQLLAKHLKPRAQVVAWNRTPRAAAARKLGVPLVSLKEAAASDVVVLSVAMSAMEGMLRRVAPLVRPGALVMDVCSVKAWPCRLMRRLLPRGVAIIGSHPLFGPQSAAKGLQGLQVVLSPVRARPATVRAVKRFIERMGLEVVVMTPEGHDRAMARTQALAHFLARALVKVAPEERPLRLKSFEKIWEAVEMVRHDSPRLFRDLQTLNLAAAPARRALLRELLRIDSSLRRR